MWEISVWHLIVPLPFPARQSSALSGIKLQIVEAVALLTLPQNENKNLIDGRLSKDQQEILILCYVKWVIQWIKPSKYTKEHPKT